MLIGVPITDLATQKEGYVIRIISESLFEVEFEDGVKHFKMDDVESVWDYA